MQPWWGDAYMVALFVPRGPILSPTRSSVRLAEAAIRNATDAGFDFSTASGLRSVRLSRAGRYDEAIRRVQKGFGWGSGGPADCAFLSMAHHRLGHREEALRWLDRLRQDQLPH